MLKFSHDACSLCPILFRRGSKENCRTHFQAEDNMQYCIVDISIDTQYMRKGFIYPKLFNPTSLPEMHKHFLDQNFLKDYTLYLLLQESIRCLRNLQSIQFMSKLRWNKYWQLTKWIYSSNKMLLIPKYVELPLHSLYNNNKVTAYCIWMTYYLDLFLVVLDSLSIYTVILPNAYSAAYIFWKIIPMNAART